MRTLALLAALAATPALAAPATSLRPEARPGGAVLVQAAGQERKNPLGAIGRLFQPKAPAVRAVPAAAPPRPGGGLCGIPGLAGGTGRSIAGKLNGCGLSDGVQIHHVEGIALTQGASMDCATARAFHDWVTRSAIPAMGARGGGIAKIHVAAGYACRTRNNRPGGKISEHGKGRAIDIGGFVLRDGTRVTVLDHWRSGAYGPALKAMHRDACGPFKTVIGPDGDRYHRDHFHLDTARRKNGYKYCR